MIYLNQKLKVKILINLITKLEQTTGTKTLIDLDKNRTLNFFNKDHKIFRSYIKAEDSSYFTKGNSCLSEKKKGRYIQYKMNLSKKEALDNELNFNLLLKKKKHQTEFNENEDLKILKTAFSTYFSSK